jgi:hypothetical protein
MAVTTGSAPGTGADAGTEEDEREVPPFWGEDSTPFAADGGRQPCDVVLKQVDDNNFALEKRLLVDAPAGTGDMPASTIVIEPAWLDHCDLASIPTTLGWFARRHGRHTPASLVHDLLIVSDESSLPPAVPAEWRLKPEQADVLFRELLLASGVPPVRSYLMWAAVAARTRWHSGLRRRATLILWGLCAGAGSVALVAGVAGGNVALAIGALVAPAVAAALWGGQYPAGVVAGYAAWWAVAGSAPAWVAYKIYQGVEGAVWLVKKVRKLVRGEAAPDPGPPPTPHDQR